MKIKLYIPKFIMHWIAPDFMKRMESEARTLRDMGRAPVRSIEPMDGVELRVQADQNDVVSYTDRLKMTLRK